MVTMTSMTSPTSPSAAGLLRAVASAVALGLVGGTAVLLPAATAHAATTSAAAFVSDAYQVAEYTAASGQANRVAYSWTSNSAGTATLFTIDDVVDITAGTGCSHPDGSDLTRVTCTVTYANATETSGPPGLVVQLGDGADTATDRTYDGVASTHEPVNHVYAGSGHDTLVGGARDLLYGEGGDDTLTGGLYMYGGSGNDVISACVKECWGDSGTDTLSAGPDAAFLHGGADNDQLHGGAGGDVLYGDSGSDKLYGGKGDDHLYGGSGNDTLYGNSGTDVLYGNAGDDYLSGGPGTDSLHGGDGSNRLIQ